MPSTVRCTSVVVNGDGSITEKWSDGQGRTFRDLEEYRDDATELDRNPDVTKRLCRANLLRLSSTLTGNLSQGVNRDFTFNLAVFPPITIV